MGGRLCNLEHHSTQKALKTGASGVYVAPKIDWVPPLAGLLKMNIDATLRKGQAAIGVGVVIRDEKGMVVAALSRPYVVRFFAETGQLVAFG
ncbi:hypothetical protein ACOSP7_016762 [Xanthoceras sorbifolium]